MNTRFLSGSLVLLFTPWLFAADATNNFPGINRQPPAGRAIPDDARRELSEGVASLGREIDALRQELKSKPALLPLLPDVQIYHKAVHWALTYDEFLRTNEVATARTLIRQGLERAQLLRAGQAPWTTAPGLVVRGYVSRIDDSVQPYGLVVPATYQPDTAHRFRLDCWFHGRGETLTELDFIQGRQRTVGEFAPPNAFVLHLYGRYCNGSRFAGETDLFEALEQVRKHYPIDENRLVVRGFSLGGASTWHLATHHAGLWVAAAPGAGFSETSGFLRLNLSGTNAPPWYQQKLWHLYDSTDYAVNLANLPTVAYSGEIDGQKQATDMMAKALAAEGMEMTHIIGPKTAHSYHRDSKIEIERRLESIVARGRDPLPDKVRFTTWTLRYNQMHWVTVDALEQHWERARVDAELDSAANEVRAMTTNVSALTFTMASGLCPLDTTQHVKVILDGQRREVASPQSDRSWTARFHKEGNQWISGELADTSTLRKQHGLQGPIDDAFMESFLMVRPTGKAASEKVGAWVDAEFAHATEHWRRHFRGDARVKADTEITDADIAAHNLVLWGDPASNQLLAKIADRLPVRWDTQNVTVGAQTFAAANHVPVLIHPNPLNPKKYVVLNSGFTFREYDYLNNARQTPKLPDFAVVDVSVPVSARTPGGIVTAGFFGETWELPKP